MKIVFFFLAASLCAETFTQITRRETAAILQAIIEHPFIQEMANGTLSTEKFDYYLEQDQLYVVLYGQSIAAIASRVSSSKDVVFLVNQSLSACSEHGDRIPSNLKQCPMCLAYSMFEHDTAVTKPVGQGIAAILPCYRIYVDVAKWLKANSVPNNPYQKWIDQYNDPAFEVSTIEMERLADRIYARELLETQKNMLQDYQTSTRFEWYFWDSAYRLAKWLP